MKQPQVRETPSPCDGPHQFHPHDHSHVPAEYRAARCSGRFLCVRCEQWFRGTKCDPAGMGPQRAAEPAEPPVLVAALA